MRMTPDDMAAIDRVTAIFEYFRARHGETHASNLTLATMQVGKPATTNNGMYSVEQAAKRLNVSDKTVRRLCDSGELQYVKLQRGGKRALIRISEEQIQTYLGKGLPMPTMEPPQTFRHLQVSQTTTDKRRKPCRSRAS